MFDGIHYALDQQFNGFSRLKEEIVIKHTLIDNLQQELILTYIYIYIGTQVDFFGKVLYFFDKRGSCLGNQENPRLCPHTPHPTLPTPIGLLVGFSWKLSKERHGRR
jgi:hypothetical protein